MNWDMLLLALMIVPCFLVMKIGAAFMVAIFLGADFDYERNEELMQGLSHWVDAICVVVAAYCILDWRIG